MRVATRVAVVGMLLLPFAAASASAQTWKWDWNINGGYSHYSSMLKAEDTGISGASGSDVRFKAGGLLGSQLTFWFGRSIGLRFNGTYADRPVEAKNFTLLTPAGSGLNHVNLWSGTADLMFRLAQPKAEYTGMEMLPYIALGVGAKWHNPAHDNYTCNDTAENKSWACAPFALQNGTTPGNSFELAEANTVMGLAGLGADWRVARSIAIRTEIGDRIYKPHIQMLAAPGVLTSPVATTFNVSGGGVSKMVNEIYGQIGLGFLFGIARPPAVAVAPAPEPPPAPAPAPVPTVSREAMSVCVVDPTSSTGLRMQDAFLVGGKDTVVVVNGADQPLSTSIGTVPVVTTADWYVRGQPLTITVGKNNYEFATYGSSRMINSTDLAYLGTVNGLPVYADRNDVGTWIGDWNTARTSNADIGTILVGQPTLRTNFQNVKVLYVPTAASGCTFQAVQRQEEVRKSGK